MTLDEMKEMDREYLTPMQVCKVLHCHAYGINVAAREHPETLGFPVIMVGKRVKIPRRAFIKYMEGA